MTHAQPAPRAKQIANAPASVRYLDSQSGRELPFLILGADRQIPSAMNSHVSIGTPCAGIILLTPIELAQLTAALEDAPDPALPIADFGSNDSVRRDFVGSILDATTIHELEQHFAPIWRRLAEIPFSAEREARAELTILRLAYSRDTEIKAAFAPDSRRLVEYPLLGTAAGAQRQLEMLAGLDLLHRRHFTRTHACEKCGSARVHVYEACPGCGASELKEETLVHHYRCGCQEIESHFTQAELLLCPKCHRVLHHFGVDYGKPGKTVVCAACGATNSEPSVRFACLDCSSVTAADDAPALDWYHYALTDDGVRALHQGRLPQFDIAPLLESLAHTYSPREFRLLALQELRVSARFNLPFSVGRFTVLNLESLLHEHGPIATEAGFRHVVDAVVTALRTSDFVSIGTKLSAVIGFPGTSAKEIAVIVQRIRRTIDESMTSHVELGVEVAEGDAIIEMLAKS
jgi:hypothetical protein